MAKIIKKIYGIKRNFKPCRKLKKNEKKKKTFVNKYSSVLNFAFVIHE